MTGAPRTAGARADGPVEALVLAKADFDHIRSMSPELDEDMRRLAADRVDELGERKRSQMDQTLSWVRQAAEALRAGKEAPSGADVRQARREHGGATLGVWLGILLDGIPESFVIGAAFLAALTIKAEAGQAATFTQVIPYTLIAGLFLSNFPEAMSSSVLMAEHGWTARKILFMWSTILIVTMIGSGLGYAAGELLPPLLVVGAQGVAAGAMLTMIASTMIPEAVHLGSSSAVGLSTLGGFLAAVAFKLLE